MPSCSSKDNDLKANIKRTSWEIQVFVTTEADTKKGFEIPTAVGGSASILALASICSSTRTEMTKSQIQEVEQVSLTS